MRYPRPPYHSYSYLSNPSNSAYFRGLCRPPKIRKIPAPIKIKSALPPPPQTQNPPPQKKTQGTRIFLRKDSFSDFFCNFRRRRASRLVAKPRGVPNRQFVWKSLLESRTGVAICAEAIDRNLRGLPSRQLDPLSHDSFQKPPRGPFNWQGVTPRNG